MSAASELMQAIYTKLTGDSAFVVQLGSGVVTDRLLEKKVLPCVVFAEVDSRDYSTASERGQEHFIRIDIWGEGQSRKQLQGLSHSIKQLLNDAALELGGGHRLVSLFFISERAARDKGKAEQLVSLRFRAVTEEAAVVDGIDP